ncbi:DUF1127 domain-containing protein [Octadecabacter ascidiaceicola]|uniref:YjiS-like domain-containing protein n=1 Tax=Octadecabacter ascidiaceicola TaxID=1655543 RepID=A0A238K5F2_9RHOB|nr:DUF1127 domain-containing protein [Octadecabacter ascidiaceicola]SMX37332.1 hypothetical protein OCA8868_01397 [Octadecabacter ascidiaceicola]
MTLSLSRTTATTCTQQHKAPAPSLFTFLTVWKERRELAGLSEARLKDIGVSPRAAAQEAARPVWDLPSRHR